MDKTNCSLYQQARFREAAGAEFRPGGLALTEELAEACALQPGDSVLDLGCGVGSTASFLAREFGVSMIGLDSSPRFIQEAQARDPQVRWVIGSSQEIPFPNCHFDVVFSECFLSGFDDAGSVLQEIRRVLRPRGRLAVTDMYLRAPSNDRPVHLAPAATCLRGAVGKDETLEHFALSGFVVRIWRDRSDALTALMASLIFAYGSAASFWEAAGAGRGVQEALRAERPGYYLLVAQPNADDHGIDPREARRG
jgi:SAM-dependent methyltransferase